MMMLQSFALVAPVPRTEDVGTDAVVTLLRDYDGKRVIAEDSLFVQIKSESVTEVVYEGDQVKWLFELDLPLFYASVDRKAGILRFFCAHELSEAYIMNHARKKVTIDFSDKGNWIDLMSADDERVKIGPPVMQWTLDDCAEPTMAWLFHRLIKDHVRIAKRNLATRKFGFVTYLGWETNQPLVEGLMKSSSSRPASEHMERLYNEMMPYFISWTISLTYSGEVAQMRDVEKLLANAKRAMLAIAERRAKNQTPGQSDEGHQ
ncbi:hypothetical protein WH367_10765 [Comamonas sp. MYb21]|uniref:hypothetical protein n=1 Tax=Comamonas sp. MYb21 TaxID=1848648 RepID=UPI0030A69198